jgi:hypothetical protein
VQNDVTCLTYRRVVDGWLDLLTPYTFDSWLQAIIALPLFPHLSWGWVVSFTLRPLYPRWKSTMCQLDRRLGGPPEPVWTTWRRENCLPYQDSNSDLSVVQPIVSRYSDSVRNNIHRKGEKLCNEWRAFPSKFQLICFTPRARVCHFVMSPRSWTI